MTDDNKKDNISIKGDDGNGGTNTERMESIRVSRNNYNLRKQGSNSEKMASLIGSSEDPGILTAGVSGWLSYNREETIDEEGSDFGIPRDVQRRSKVKLSPYDSAGRILSEKTQQKFRNTVLKSSKGVLLSLYHWTNAIFTEFKYGDLGFHIGTLGSAINRCKYSKKDASQVSIYKEMYDVSRRPFIVDGDACIWTVEKLSSEFNVLTHEEIEQIKAIDEHGFKYGRYDSAAVKEFIRIMEKLADEYKGNTAFRLMPYAQKGDYIQFALRIDYIHKPFGFE